MQYPILAAIDLGSNSFRLQLARAEDDQLYMLDGLREPVRLAAGLDAQGRLDAASRQRALDCLRRFAERLRGLPPEAVRAVGTNTLRVAKDTAEFQAEAEAVLGFPIQVIAGREEARLIYLGVAHGLPPGNERRLVMDIGGGSTEFILGQGLESRKLESLYMGSVSYSLRYFPDGKVSKAAMRQAELAARTQLQLISADFARGHWDTAYGSSGTARAVSELMSQNGFSDGEITREGLEVVRERLLKAADVKKLDLQGIKPDRLLALPGGFSILHAVFCELGIERMRPASGALREGVLYDLFGRFHDQDMRELTVRQFMRRYHVESRQAERVAQLAGDLARQFLGAQADSETLHLLGWAARLHEIGISVAHNGYNKHSAYILKNADMPGFSRREQDKLSLLAVAQRGKLEKVRGLFSAHLDIALVMALRLAVLLCRSRGQARLPALVASSDGRDFSVRLPDDWLKKNPLSEAALFEESLQWQGLGIALRIENPQNDS